MRRGAPYVRSVAADKWDLLPLGRRCGRAVHLSKKAVAPARKTSADLSILFSRR